MALKELKVPDSGAIANPNGTEAILGFYNQLADFAKGVKRFFDGTIVDSRDWEMRFVENGTYSLALNTPFGMEIAEVTTDCDSGTCTATIEINGTPLGGSPNSVSTAEQVQSHTSDNVAEIGDDVRLVIGDNAGCENMRLSFKFTRPLIV